MKAKRVFVSYVQENRQVVMRLVAELERRGAEVWVDYRALPAGVFWRDEIRKAIREHEFFIACFSREYNTRIRTYMNEELELAIEEIRQRGSTPWFIPVLLSGVIPDRSIGANRTLHDIQYIQLSENTWTEAIDAIATAVKGGARAATRAAAARAAAGPLPPAAPPARPRVRWPWAGSSSSTGSKVVSHINELIEAMGVTQQQFAALVGVDSRTIAKMTSGDNWRLDRAAMERLMLVASQHGFTQGLFSLRIHPIWTTFENSRAQVFRGTDATDARTESDLLQFLHQLNCLSDTRILEQVDVRAFVAAMKSSNCVFIGGPAEVVLSKLSEATPTDETRSSKRRGETAAIIGIRRRRVKDSPAVTNIVVKGQTNLATLVALQALTYGDPPLTERQLADGKLHLLRYAFEVQKADIGTWFSVVA